MRKICLALVCLFAAVNGFSQGSTFQFTNAGSIPALDAALDYTGLIWGHHLQSTVPIKVNTYYAALGAGTTLAVTLPNGRRDFSAATLDSTWYPSCLANAMEGTELNPGEADMDVIINSDVNWYFGTDGNPGPGQFDFVSVALHEIGHGLGFLSIAKWTSGEGSFGYVTLADVQPFPTSFPFPDLAGKYSVFSYYMTDTNGVLLRDTTVYPNPSNTLGSAFTSNDIYFDAPLSATENGGPVRIYAPPAWASGSSMQHLNESTYPAGNPNTLMTPFISAGEVHHDPGPLTLAMLEDMGWTVDYTTAVHSLASLPEWNAFPNPGDAELNLRFNHRSASRHISLSDLSGQVVMQLSSEAEVVTLPVASFSAGLYFITIKEEGAPASIQKWMKQ